MNKREFRRLIIVGCLIGLIALVVKIARADLSDCIDATCRIRAPAANGKAGMGTGCVFEVSQGQVFVLTAAHVVEGASSVNCDFWQVGHQSAPLPATVIGRSSALDAAILSLPQTAFGGRMPKPIPILERGKSLGPGQTLMSAGCSNGAWPSGWRGHVLADNGREIRFVPVPANGRSGSALFDEPGTRIVGVLQARNDAAGQGIGTSTAALYAFFTRQQTAAAKGIIIPDELMPVQCGPNGCGPGGCPQPTPQYGGYGRIQGPRGGIIGGGGYSGGVQPGGPWPTLPGNGGGELMPIPVPTPAVPSVDATAEQIHRQYLIPFRNDMQRQQDETQRRLDQIQQMLQAMQQATPPGAIPAPIPAPIPTPAPEPPKPEGPRTLPGRIADREAEWLAEHGGPISSRIAKSADEKLDSDSAAVRFVGFTQAKVALVIFCTAILLILALGIWVIHRINNRLIPKLQAMAAKTPGTLDDKLVGLLSNLHEKVNSVEDRVKSHLPGMAALKATADAALHVGTAAALAVPAGPVAAAGAATAAAAAEAIKAHTSQ